MFHPQRLPLEGIRVLDLSRLLPGPFATMVLADLGASVDKLEDPKEGDYLRVMPPLVDGVNAAFSALNRGKRSVVLDLKTEAGRDAFLQLIPRYDVLVESFRPGVMDKLGLGWEVLRRAHPSLVMCAMSGYGQTGPLAQRAGHDLLYLARAGVLGMAGPAETPPAVPPIQSADLGGALFAVSGILAALLARNTSKQGAFIDLSLCDSALSLATLGLLWNTTDPPRARGDNTLSGGIAPYQTYPTRDGKHVALAALEPKFWSAFCQGVGIEAELAALLPGAHQAALKEALAAIFREKTRAEWEAFAARHDCCLEPVLDPTELVDDPHHRARAAFIRDARSAVDQPRSPLVSADRARPAPAHGEHTEAILREAGLDPAALAQSSASSAR